MNINDYISQQPEDRQALMQAIHQIILKNDTHADAAIGSMMGKQMIIYNQRNFFKYALASVKEHMSLHVLPIYSNAPLHTKYQQLLPDAKFQKGCINFKIAAEMPLPIIEALITDCSMIDLLAIREEYLKKKRK